VTDTAIAELAPEVGVRAACEALGAAQAGYYRRHRQSRPPQRPDPIPHRDRHQPRALTETERQAVLEQLHSDRFVDVSPTEVWATLLDEGVYLGSISTFYRLLRQAGQSRERRRQATHPATVRPELVATEPNQVWSWDITKLRGPAKWTYYYLYVILDIFSRYVVGWMVAHAEQAALAERLAAAVGVAAGGDVEREARAQAGDAVDAPLDAANPGATILDLHPKRNKIVGRQIALGPLYDGNGWRGATADYLV
jgi:putative transposase